jgi:quinolinate synthase
MTNDRVLSLQAEIIDLNEEKNAIILAHNYQRQEIQEIADFRGDSLELAQKAAHVGEIERIVFCGVDFMAETAAILNPAKKVLLPNLGACCPMAAQLPAKRVLEYKNKNPGIPFVVYINTRAETKAVADITCTSANAVEVVRSLGSEKVAFGPDANLAFYVSTKLPNIEIEPVPSSGGCYVHTMFDPSIILFREDYPGCFIMAHPECDPEVQEVVDYVGSTSQMIKRAHELDVETIVIATEVDLINRLKMELPKKKILPALESALCRQMKKITLEDVRDTLIEDKHQVTVPREIALRAKYAIERMLQITS